MADERNRTGSITEDFKFGASGDDMDTAKGVEIYRESLLQIQSGDAGVPSVFVVMGASVSLDPYLSSVALCLHPPSSCSYKW